MTERWNHNIHYHAVILGRLPGDAQDAMDVGCGAGVLTRELRERIPHVIGIDRDPASITRARNYPRRPRLDYLLADFLTYPFEPASFDVIVSVAALHHMSVAAALPRMRELLRPGGTLAIIGLARNRLPADLPRELAAITAARCYRLTRNYWEQTAPTVWPPPHTHHEMRRIAGELLPGARFRRHLLWRYTLIWTKPAQDTTTTAENIYSRQ